MAKTLSVDLVLNSMGFKQGIEQAKEGTEQYASAVKISDANIKALNRAMTNSQKEARALAIAFNSLSKAEQESAKGKALQRQMWETAEAAAKLRDITDDTNAMIKAMASDTAGLDALKEGMDIGKSAATAYAGAIAKLSGNEKALKDVVANIAMIEGAFGTAIKINTALQKQSSIMIGIRRIQLLASKKAIEAETAATKGATIAQKAFNLVAKANPYVLLATAAVAAAAALTGFMIATSKNTEEEKKAAKAAEDLKKKQEELRKKQGEIAETAAKTRTKFFELQVAWENLKTQAEKKKWIDENQNAFKELGLSITSVKTAENIFINMTDDVCDALLRRAIAAKKADQAAQDLIDMEKKYETTGKTKKTARAEAGDVAPAGKGIPKEWKDAKLEVGVDFVWDRSANSVDEKALAVETAKLTEAGAKKLNEARHAAAQKELQENRKNYLKEKKQKEEEYKENLKAEAKANKDLKKLGDAPKGGGSETTKKQLTELQKLTQAADDYQKKIENIKDPTTEAGQQELADLQQKWANAALAAEKYKHAIGEPVDTKNIEKIAQILNYTKKQTNDLKIELGVKLDENDVDEYEKELKDRIKQVEKDYKIAVKNNDEAAKQAAADAYYTAQRELNNYELTVKIKPVMDPQKFNEAFSKIEEKVTKQDKTWNFDGLNEDMQKQANDMVKRIDTLKDAQKELIDLQKQTNDPGQLKQIKERIDAYKEEEQALSAYADKLEELSDGLKAKEKKFKRFSDTIGTIGDAVGVINSMQGAITSLGDAFDEGASGWEKFTAVLQMGMTVLQAIITIMGIINTIQEIFNTGKAVAGQETTKEAAAHTANATAIAAETAATTANAAVETAAIAPTMALTQAMMKLAAANIFNAHSFIPFAGPAIAAGFVGAMEALVNSIVAFKDGGIVPGNSFSGDKVLARLNSNEMVLNTQQQKRLFAMLNGLEPLRGNSQVVEIQGVIRGKDLMLVQKNYNSLAGKSKQNINIG